MRVMFVCGPFSMIMVAVQPNCHSIVEDALVGSGPWAVTQFRSSR
jgi:hypothetical protein